MSKVPSSVSNHGYHRLSDLYDRVRPDLTTHCEIYSLAHGIAGGGPATGPNDSDRAEPQCAQFHEHKQSITST